MVFLDFHKERVRKKELAAGTLKNYYRSAKLPKECEKCLVGLNAITKEACNTAQQTEDKREKRYRHCHWLKSAIQ
jgi:hypothetical protein